MPKSKGLKAKPSKIILSSGQELTIEELEKGKKITVCTQLCSAIAIRIQKYFSGAWDEWETFFYTDK